MIRYLTHEQSRGLRFTGTGERPHRPDVTFIGHLRDQNTVFQVVAALETFHHEALGWAQALERDGLDAYIIRPRGWDGGCPCNRCQQGWTQAQGDPRDSAVDPT